MLFAAVKKAAELTGLTVALHAIDTKDLLQRALAVTIAAGHHPVLPNVLCDSGIENLNSQSMHSSKVTSSAAPWPWSTSLTAIP
jgi:hypothetical protein